MSDKPIGLWKPKPRAPAPAPGRKRCRSTSKTSEGRKACAPVPEQELPVFDDTPALAGAGAGAGAGGGGSASASVTASSFSTKGFHYVPGVVKDHLQAFCAIESGTSLRVRVAAWTALVTAIGKTLPPSCLLDQTLLYLTSPAEALDKWASLFTDLEEEFKDVIEAYSCSLDGMKDLFQWFIDSVKAPAALASLSQADMLVRAAHSEKYVTDLNVSAPELAPLRLLRGVHKRGPSAPPLDDEEAAEQTTAREAVESLVCIVGWMTVRGALEARACKDVTLLDPTIDFFSVFCKAMHSMWGGALVANHIPTVAPLVTTLAAADLLFFSARRLPWDVRSLSLLATAGQAVASLTRYWAATLPTNHPDFLREYDQFQGPQPLNLRDVLASIDFMIRRRDSAWTALSRQNPSQWNNTSFSVAASGMVAHVPALRTTFISTPIIRWLPESP